MYFRLTVAFYFQIRLKLSNILWIELGRFVLLMFLHLNFQELILNFNDMVYMVTLLTTSLGLVSSVILAIIAKTLKGYYADLECIIRLHRSRSNIV